MPILLIVESPSKCDTIQKYVGNEYKVVASKGHFRSLQSLEDIDFNNYNITYKKDTKIVSYLKNEISRASSVILASDDDREGESIAWHICDEFGLSFSNTKRIYFQEITKECILKSLQETTFINMDRVHSQQTRQILDLYIGFKISPLLWKNIKNKLSAGRCQTPSLKLIQEKELDYERSSDDKVVKVSGYFTNQLIKFNLDVSLDALIIEPFLEECKTYRFSLLDIIKKTINSSPPSILITSSLQKECQSILNLKPSITMMCAQKLYEKGYITYMRTDYPFYSDEFLQKISLFLKNNFQKPKQMNKKGPQAHEGIRITNLDCKEVSIDTNCNRLYLYIYKRTLQSCCLPCIENEIIYSTKTPMDHLFIYKNYEFIQKGWKEYQEKKEEVYWGIYLQNCNELSMIRIEGKEVLKEVKNHWNESQLISNLEKKGIGRPSTYTHIVKTIQDKNYVKIGNYIGNPIVSYDYLLKENEIIKTKTQIKREEKNVLSITKLGNEVCNFCLEYFPDLFNYDYTSKMENELDQIEMKEKEWKEYLNEKIKEINESIEKDMKKRNITYEKEEYNFTFENNEYKIKKGKFGYYIEFNEEKKSLENFKEPLTSEWLSNLDEEKIRGLIDYIKKDTIVSEYKNGWSLRISKFGYYLYHKTNKMKKPKFYKVTNKIDIKDDNKILEFIKTLK